MNPLPLRNIRFPFHPIDEASLHDYLPLEDVVVIPVGAISSPPPSSDKWPVRFTTRTRACLSEAAAELSVGQVRRRLNSSQSQPRIACERSQSLLLALSHRPAICPFRLQEYVVCGFAADVARCMAELATLAPRLHMPLYALADGPVCSSGGGDVGGHSSFGSSNSSSSSIDISTASSSSSSAYDLSSASSASSHDSTSNANNTNCANNPTTNPPPPFECSRFRPSATSAGRRLSRRCARFTWPRSPR